MPPCAPALQRAPAALQHSCVARPPQRAHLAPPRAAAASAGGAPQDGSACSSGGFQLPGTSPTAQSSARALCAVCAGTGLKPCGQCNGSGVNNEDLFGGRFVAGDPCWLCEGAAKTMCGACADMTDTF